MCVPWHCFPFVHPYIDILFAVIMSHCLQWLTFFWTLLPRLLLFALCLLCMLIVIPTSEPLPDYHWFPADNWTVNEIWWTDGPSPWGQLPCPLWLSRGGSGGAPDTFLPRYTWIPILSIRLSSWRNGQGGFIWKKRATWMESFQSQQL